MHEVRAVLLDIDGVLTVSWRPIPGAAEAVAWLREAGYQVALVTNTTSRTRASVPGTPAHAFFATALTALGVTAAHAAMVGDDIHSDVLAAQRAGMTGVLVRTGKYLEQTHHDAPAEPDHVIESIAGLPALLAGPASAK